MNVAMLVEQAQVCSLDQNLRQTRHYLRMPSVPMISK